MIHRPHKPTAAQQQFRGELKQSLQHSKGGETNVSAPGQGAFNIFSATKHWFDQQRGDADYR